MPKMQFLLAVLCLCSGAPLISSSGDLPSLEQILERHNEALGGRERVDAVQSVVFRFEYREGNFVIPHAYMAKMRPYYKTICDPAEEPGEICEGYDGSAWEWYRDPGVTLRTVGAAAAAARHGTYLIDWLVDYKARRTRIVMSGNESFDGKQTYKLRVTLADGYEEDTLVDSQSFLIAGTRRSAPIHAFGKAVRSENHFSDYRPVNGVLFPFVVREIEIATGKELNRETVDAITVNDSSLTAGSFGPRQAAPTSFQLCLGQLYMERTDPASVLYSYREYRAAHPEADTREGVEFIGYQMTKMGDYSGAIALLKANAGDYPRAASAQFGLGRTYEAAGQWKEARAAFQRALEIDPNFKKARDGMNAVR